MLIFLASVGAEYEIFTNIFLADESSQRKMLGSLCGFESQVSFLLILAVVGNEYEPLSHDWEPRIRPKKKDLRKIMGCML